MAGSNYVRADIGKLETFINESSDCIREFSEIRKEFDRINNTLFQSWEGAGRASYENVVSHITEKITGISEILDAINDGVIKDIVDYYNDLDKQLGDYNRTAGDPKEGE
ncbi:MAG: hypothetical protein VZR27_04995 [Acutalibacteraceae bacterium]|nr:hypothetical protein [Clostridia bacterium]MEE3450042.1 hypothetical protein [Acutalibacteraceae bacterium]